MRTASRYGLMLLVAGLSTGLATSAALAQTYPSRPIHIHTASAGGGSDVVARLFASEASGPLGQPIIVENKPNGLPLFLGVLKGQPDGYTLLVTAASMWTSPLLGIAPYDGVRDFAPISGLTSSPNVLMVHASMPGNVAEFIRYAKSKPGALNYSAGSTGSSSHLAGEMFKYLGGLDIQRITYKAQAQETADLASGQVQMTISNATSLSALIKAGKIKAIAQGGTKRSLLFPDLPPLSDTLPGFQSQSLYAFFGLAKTPDPIIRRLNQETLRMLDKPANRDMLLSIGQEPAGSTPEQLGEAVRSEVERLGKMIKDVGIKADS